MSIDLIKLCNFSTVSAKMARDELKDQRVVTMMTPSELQAIDDWMFANRIRSRGEAIRRLCQVGLQFDDIFDDARAVAWDLYRWSVATRRVAKRVRDSAYPAKIWRDLSLVNALRFATRASLIVNVLALASGSLRKFREVVDLDEAFAEAQRIRGENEKALRDDVDELAQGIPLPAEVSPLPEDFPDTPEHIIKLLLERGLIEPTDGQSAS